MARRSQHRLAIELPRHAVTPEIPVVSPLNAGA
jgi:hypothetical protein